MLSRLIGPLFRKDPTENLKAIVAEADAAADSGNVVAAEKGYLRAIGLNSEMFEAHAGLGCLYLIQKRYPEAANCFKTLLDIRPHSRDGAAWLGQAAFCQHDYRSAATNLSKAHAIVPLDIEGCYLLASALINCGEMDAAQRILDEAQAIAPNDPLLKWVAAIKNLTCGCWREGFALYESRFDASRAYPDVFGGNRPGAVLGRWFDDPAVPIWEGQPLSGKRLLLRAEQGLGDSIMMLRFLAVLREKGAATLTLWAPPALRELAMAVDPAIHFVEDNRGWNAQAGEFDFQCALMSLPNRLGVKPETMPGGEAYIDVPQHLRQLWAARVCSLRGLRVGIVWQSGRLMPAAELRDVPCEHLLALGGRGEVTLVSLQKEVVPRAEHAPLFVDWMGECETLLDTAALIVNLDLVISVDTAVAHLAGAVGANVWLLNRFESDWRWGRGQETTPWYPAMRIFNQELPRDWAMVMASVARELKELTSN